MKRKVRIADREVEIQCCDSTCDANQWGWDCEFVGRGNRLLGQPPLFCKLFRVRLEAQPDGHAYRAGVCRNSEVRIPTLGIRGGNDFGGSGGSPW